MLITFKEDNTTSSFYVIYCICSAWSMHVTIYVQLSVHTQLWYVQIVWVLVFFHVFYWLLIVWCMIGWMFSAPILCPCKHNMDRNLFVSTPMVMLYHYILSTILQDMASASLYCAIWCSCVFDSLYLSLICHYDFVSLLMLADLLLLSLLLLGVGSFISDDVRLYEVLM